MIRLTPAVEQALVTHAREGAPEEVCGVLGGVRSETPRTREEQPATDRRSLGQSARAPTTAQGDDRAGPSSDVPGGLQAEERTDDRPDVVSTLRRVDNAADDPRSRYELHPAGQLRAMRDLEARRLDVVGFYHSHPRGPAGPSATDERLATWPGRVYVIVTLAGDEPSVGAWRWTGEAFAREPVTVGNDP